jgi:hypothetical protein
VNRDVQTISKKREKEIDGYIRITGQSQCTDVVVKRSWEEEKNLLDGTGELFY